MLSLVKRMVEGHADLVWLVMGLLCRKDCHKNGQTNRVNTVAVLIGRSSSFRDRCDCGVEWSFARDVGIRKITSSKGC